MSRQVAFLRGVNLGKSRRVKNEALREAFEQLGFDDVATFRASGNVVFDGRGRAAELRARIEAGLAEALGIEIMVFLRSGGEVGAIAAHEPFEARKMRPSAGKLQVALLAANPEAAVCRQALALASERDPLALAGRELYWLPSGRMVDSELDLKALESLVGPWTMRTMGTIEQIAARHCP
ncbi:MAG: DUF1697 domain-containing protein [Solirubrobacterales bacterium]